MSNENYICENLCIQDDTPRRYAGDYLRDTPVCDNQIFDPPPGLNRAQRRRWIFGHAKDHIGKRRGGE
jgi:hypothetical protein